MASTREISKLARETLRQREFCILDALSAQGFDPTVLSNSLLTYIQFILAALIYYA